MRETGRLSPMRHTPPFSPRSSPPTEPGQPGYLRGMLCALRYSVAPIRDLVTDLKSRRNLVVPCARFDLDAGEIASRLQIRHQAKCSRNRVTELAEYTAEILGTAGFVPIRQNGRVRWWLAHGCLRGFYGNLRIRAKTLQDAPMRQAPPYSATLSNRNEPGHSRYLRDMLCALRQMVTPLDGPGSVARSRRNLACI